MVNMNLMKGDCLELMKSIPDGCVDMILTDPPFGTTKCSWDSVIPFEPMWNELNRIIKPNGCVLLFAQTPFDKVLGASNINMLKYEWVWEKTAATGHLNAKKMPMKAHENILVFYSKLPNYYPIKTTGHVRKSSTADRGRLESEVYGSESGVTTYDSTERYPRSVLKFSSDKQKSNLHPTQKPVALLEYLIKTYTQEGETVLDFTAGSMSTAIACINTNRNGIMIEKDEHYFKVGSDRVSQALQELGDDRVKQVLNDKEN